MAENGTEIGSLYYDLDAPTDKLEKSLDSGDKKVKGFAANIAKNGDQIKSTLNKTAVVAAAAAAGIGLITKKATDFTVDLVKDSKVLSREIGVTQVEASRLTAAFGRMGIEADKSRQIFGIFSKQITASAEGTTASRLANEKLRLQIAATKKSISETSTEMKKSGDKSGELNTKLQTLRNTLKSQELALKSSSTAFERLGVQTVDQQGKQRAFIDVLFDTADAFKKLPDGAEKTALSMELFGKSGKDLLGVLNLGSDGIKNLEAEADRLGLTLSMDTIAKVNALVQSQKDLKQSTEAMQIAIGTATAPILTEFNQILNDVIMSLLNSDGPLKTITASFFAFAPPVFTGISALAGLGANLVTVSAAFPKATATMVAFGGSALSILGPLALIAAGLLAIAAAARSVTSAFNAMNEAAKSQADMEASNAQVLARLQNLQKSGTPAQKARATKAINAGIGRNAEGTDNWRGGLTWVGEKGPEILDVPKGSKIFPNDVSKQMVKPTPMIQRTTVNIGQVNDKSDADYIIRRVDRNYQLEQNGMTPV